MHPQLGFLAIKLPDGLRDGHAVDLGGEGELVHGFGVQTVKGQAVLPGGEGGGVVRTSVNVHAEELLLGALAQD